jgi:hypothetical protein
MEYFAHYEEDAVIREDENGECFAKLWSVYAPGKGRLISEYKLGENSDMRYGNPDYQSLPIKISKEEYDTFGITWIFGGNEWKPPFPKIII